MNRLLCVLAWWSIAVPAFAYVDPGTGMLAIQGLIALVIGVIAFVRHPIQTAMRWWRRWTGKREDDA